MPSDGGERGKGGGGGLVLSCPVNQGVGTVSDLNSKVFATNACYVVCPYQRQLKKSLLAKWRETCAGVKTGIS